MGVAVIDRNANNYGEPARMRVKNDVTLKAAHHAACGSGGFRGQLPGLLVSVAWLALKKLTF
jgi:hypothetical protein